MPHHHSIERTLLIVAKEPRPGQVKTRLGATIGYDQAAQLYHAFTCDTLRVAATLGATRLALAHWPAEAAAHFRRAMPQGALVFAQQGADFGLRLNHAFTQAALAGATRMVLIGTDSPSLPLRNIEQAFAHLADPAIDVVLGPCTDGGWYLMGLRTPQPALFQEIAWSTEIVYAQTVRRIKACGLALATLPAWYDVDTAADLPHLAADLAARADAAESATLRVLAPLLASQEHSRWKIG
ncbi:MAG: TIGR04282 family arsenosugar biosynthesis glycosyltransferase [Herpetosiphonaceae bacterium]|nr:TIGR04282 family arsenosugar biosynthesis glycosyltransferase [Herpetosiphonaceae bacterium]